MHLQYALLFMRIIMNSLDSSRPRTADNYENHAMRPSSAMTNLVYHVSGSRSLGWGDQWRLWLFSRLRALKGKGVELSTPNLVHIHSMARPWHVLTRKSHGQRSRSHGYENRHGQLVASEECWPCAPAGVGLHVVWLLRFLVIDMF